VEVVLEQTLLRRASQQVPLLLRLPQNQRSLPVGRVKQEALRVFFGVLLSLLPFLLSVFETRQKIVHLVVTKHLSVVVFVL